MSNKQVIAELTEIRTRVVALADKNKHAIWFRILMNSVATMIATSIKAVKATTLTVGK